jgi:hypothetical protein
MKIKTHHPILTICFLALGILILPHSIVKAAQASRSFIPVVLHKGEFHPIVGVKKKKPLINIGGQLITVPKKSSVFFWSHKAAKSPTLLTGRHISSIDTGVGSGIEGGNFSTSSGGTGGVSASNMGAGGGAGAAAAPFGVTDPSAVGAQSQSTSGNQINRDQNRESVDNDQTQLWENLTSTDGPLKNAYGVFIFYSDKGIAELKWRDVKDSPEGKTRPMRIPYPSKKTLREHVKPRYMFLTFQDGEELVPSNQPDRKQFLSWNETRTMLQLAKSHKEANLQQTVDPTLIFRPDFTLSESAYENLKNKEISAIITVNGLGLVSDAYLDSDVGSSTANEILSCIRLWKFLPAIKEGRQVEEEVVIPLQF